MQKLTLGVWCESLLMLTLAKYYENCETNCFVGNNGYRTVNELTNFPEHVPGETLLWLNSMPCGFLIQQDLKRFEDEGVRLLTRSMTAASDGMAKFKFTIYHASNYHQLSVTSFV